MTLDEKLEAALQQYYADPHVTMDESISAIKQAVREELPGERKVLLTGTNNPGLANHQEGYNAAIDEMKNKLK